MFINKPFGDLIRLCRSEIGQYLLVAIFVGSITIAASVTLIRTDYRNGLAEQRLDAIEYAEHVRTQIQNSLNSYGDLDRKSVV